MRHEPRYKRITALRAFDLLCDLERTPLEVRGNRAVAEVRDALVDHVKHEITKRKRKVKKWAGFSPHSARSS